MSSTEIFRRSRDFLLANRTDYQAAVDGFRWPVLDRFNWALDWFDVIAEGERPGRRPHRQGGRAGVEALLRAAGRSVQPDGDVPAPPRGQAG